MIAFLLVGSLNFVKIRICLSRTLFLLICLFIFAASAFLSAPGQVHGTGELYYSNESQLVLTFRSGCKKQSFCLKQLSTCTCMTTHITANKEEYLEREILPEFFFSLQRLW